MNAERFDTWWEAFDCCRERNHPMTVSVPCEDRDDREVNKIFPSGAAKFVRYEPLEESAAN